MQAAAAGFDSVGVRSMDRYHLWIYRLSSVSSSVLFVSNVCITKGVTVVPFNTFDLFQRSQNRNDMVGKLRGGRLLCCLVPGRGDSDFFSLKWGNQRTSWICWVCCWRYSAVRFRWLKLIFARLQISLDFPLQVRLNPLRKPRDYIKSSRWMEYFNIPFLIVGWITNGTRCTAEYTHLCTSCTVFLSVSLLATYFATCSIWKKGKLFQ